MKAIEEKLRSAVLAEMSPAHAARMAELFDAAPAHTGLAYRPVAFWKCAVACALCVGLGFVLNGWRNGEENPPQIREGKVVQLEASSSPREFVLPHSGTERIVVSEITERADGWFEATVGAVTP